MSDGLLERKHLHDWDSSIQQSSFTGFFYAAPLYQVFQEWTSAPSSSPCITEGLLSKHKGSSPDAGSQMEAGIFSQHFTFCFCLFFNHVAASPGYQYVIY